MKAARTRAYNRKHAGTGKHAATAKHTPSSSRSRAVSHGQKAKRTAKQVKAAHATALSLSGFSCCSAEAVADSLRLTGAPVSAADVLGLYYRVATGPDAGASIWAALAAAERWGLAGVRPVSFEPVEVDDPAALILGLELPEGPHAAIVEEFWRWGDDTVTEEAWAVLWP